MDDNLATSTPVGCWKFDERVTKQFDSHVQKSVNGYGIVQDMCALTGDWLAPDGATIVDLGCSTGTTLARIAERHSGRTYSAVGYDCAQHMLDAAESKLAHVKNVSARFLNQRIEDGLIHENATLTISVFTLQFLRPEQRQSVLVDAWNRTVVGGALLIAEKTIPDDARWALIAAEQLQADKAAQGLPAEEVLAKPQTLRGVLIPRRESELIEEITASGWSTPETLWRRLGWSLVGAFKEK